MTSVIAWKTLVFPALATALILIMAMSSRAAGAESDDLALTVQVGNPGSQSSAESESCTEVSVGEVFPVDIRIENADNLIAYELRVTYDSNVLSLEEADFDHFLVSTPPYGRIFPSLFEPETANSYFLAAANTKGTADSGSGVLARLQMRAISTGVSEIGIQTEPTVYGPRLTNNKGKPMGDDTGDRIFDGTVLSAMAAVSMNCSSVIVEDPPAIDGGDPGPGATTDDAVDRSDDVSTDGIVGESSADRDPAHSADTGGGGAGGGGAGGGGAGSGVDTEDSDVDTNEDPDTDDSGPGGPGSAAGRASNDGSGLNFLWYTLIVVGAAAVLGALGLVMKSLRAR